MVEIYRYGSLRKYDCVVWINLAQFEFVINFYSSRIAGCLFYYRSLKGKRYGEIKRENPQKVLWNNFCFVMTEGKQKF